MKNYAEPVSELRTGSGDDERIEIEVMRSSDPSNAVVTTWHKVNAGKNVNPRLFFGGIKDLFSAITEKRNEIVVHASLAEVT